MSEADSMELALVELEIESIYRQATKWYGPRSVPETGRLAELWARFDTLILEVGE